MKIYVFEVNDSSEYIVIADNELQARLLVMDDCFAHDDAEKMIVCRTSEDHWTSNLDLTISDVTLRKPHIIYSYVY